MSILQSERSKRSKNISSSSQNEQEELTSTEAEDFISKQEREVIKVPNCSYSNEAKSLSKYFLCICSTSPKGFEPICEACAKVCHRRHAPTLEVPGANLCYCGLNNHIITPEMKQMYELLKEIKRIVEAKGSCTVTQEFIQKIKDRFPLTYDI